MQIEQLRERIKNLTLELETATFEKGLAAEENKDLRENFAYDYWADKEIFLTARINRLRKEINDLSDSTKIKQKKPARKTKRTDTPKIKDLPKKKWL